MSEVYFQFIYDTDPFTASKTAVGAVLLDSEERTFRYVARTSFDSVSGARRAYLDGVARRLSDQQHPWDIGPSLSIGGARPFHFVPLEVDEDEVEAWMIDALNRCGNV